MRISEIDCESAFNEAYTDACMLSNRIELPVGRYTVLLSAKAARDIFSVLGYYGLDRRSVDEGYSPFSGKLGNRIVDERVNLYTDTGHPLALSCPFDYNGLPVKKTSVIEKGILNNVPCSRFWAKKNDFKTLEYGKHYNRRWRKL
jgi:predicted Zn-dependent protease